MSEKPRNNAKKPTQISNRSARAGNSCWETQKPSRISSTPPIMPSHQAGLISREEIEVTRSRLPWKTSSSPKIAARAQNAPNGLAKDQQAANRKRIAISTCAQRHRDRIEAMRISLNQPARKTTPMSTPTATTEASRNRNTINEMTSHAIPVTRNIHHGPAIWSSTVSTLPRGPASVGDRMLMSGSLRAPASTFPPDAANDYGVPARGFHPYLVPRAQNANPASTCSPAGHRHDAGQRGPMYSPVD